MNEFETNLIAQLGYMGGIHWLKVHSSADGQEMLINTNYITCIYSDDDGATTVVSFVNGKHVLTLESYAAVAAAFGIREDNDGVE